MFFLNDSKNNSDHFSAILYLLLLKKIQFYKVSFYFYKKLCILIENTLFLQKILQ